MKSILLSYDFNINTKNFFAKKAEDALIKIK